MIQKDWVWGSLLYIDGAKESPAEEVTFKLTPE